MTGEVISSFVLGFIFAFLICCFIDYYFNNNKKYKYRVLYAYQNDNGEIKFSNTILFCDIKFKYEKDFVEAKELIEKENNLKNIQIISVNKIKIESKDVM